MCRAKQIHKRGRLKREFASLPRLLICGPSKLPNVHTLFSSHNVWPAWLVLFCRVSVSSAFKFTVLGLEQSLAHDKSHFFWKHPIAPWAMCSCLPLLSQHCLWVVFESLTTVCIVPRAAVSVRSATKFACSHPDKKNKEPSKRMPPFSPLLCFYSLIFWISGYSLFHHLSLKVLIGSHILFTPSGYPIFLPCHLLITANILPTPLEDRFFSALSKKCSKYNITHSASQQLSRSVFSPWKTNHSKSQDRQCFS